MVCVRHVLPHFITLQMAEPWRYGTARRRAHVARCLPASRSCSCPYGAGPAPLAMRTINGCFSGLETKEKASICGSHEKCATDGSEQRRPGAGGRGRLQPGGGEMLIGDQGLRRGTPCASSSAANSSGLYTRGNAKRKMTGRYVVMRASRSRSAITVPRSSGAPLLLAYLPLPSSSPRIRWSPTSHP